MKPTYIVGAKGAAKEIFLLLKIINKVEIKFDFKGFIDLDPDHTILNIGNEKFDVIDESKFLQNQTESCHIIFGIAFPKKSHQIVKRYLAKSNFDFPNLIHPGITVDSSVNIGIGNTFSEATLLTIDITIGDFNLINRGVHIGHDVKIGNYNVINPCAVISGGTQIKHINLIGTNATILQYLNIDSSNTIGAGAVVTKSILSNKTVVGIPAKSINNE